VLDLETVDLGLICEALEDHSPDHAWWIDPRTGGVDPWLDEEADDHPARVARLDPDRTHLV
jgi:hypothetical protein